jgi:hypothetical protein
MPEEGGREDGGIAHIGLTGCGPGASRPNPESSLHPSTSRFLKSLIVITSVSASMVSGSRCGRDGYGHIASQSGISSFDNRPCPSPRYEIGRAGPRGLLSWLVRLNEVQARVIGQFIGPVTRCPDGVSYF